MIVSRYLRRIDDDPEVQILMMRLHDEGYHSLTKMVMEVVYRLENISEDEADTLIRPVEETIRSRLGNWVYGADQDSLEEIALKNLLTKGFALSIPQSVRFTVVANILISTSLSLGIGFGTSLS